MSGLPRDLLRRVAEAQPPPDVPPSPAAALSEAPPARALEPLLPWQPFPVATLPAVVRRFVAEVAAALGCDVSMPALAALVALAGAIGNRRRVRLKRAWLEPSILWGAIVARSGLLKSPALKEVSRHLRRVEGLTLEADRAKREAFERELQAWADAPKASRGERPEPLPPAARLVVADITVEALAVRLQDAPGGLLLVRDELAGWLRGFNQYKSGRGGDAQAFLEMYQSGSLVVDRKQGGVPGGVISVPRAALSIVGTVQPTTLRDALGSEHFADGLAARLLLVMPPERPKAWSEADIWEDTRTAWADLLDKLRALPFAEAKAAGDDEFRPADLSLTADAKAAFVAFYTENGELEADAPSDALAAVYSKLEGAAARLALVLALARNPDVREVDAAAMKGGIALVRWFRQEAERVYSAFAETPEGRERRRLVEWLAARGGTVTARELAHSGPRRYRDSVAATTALEALVHDRLGAWEPTEPGPNGGRPTLRFRLAHTGDGTETPSPDNPPGDETSLATKPGAGDETPETASTGAVSAGDETGDETLPAGGFGSVATVERAGGFVATSVRGETVAEWEDDL